MKELRTLTGTLVPRAGRFAVAGQERVTYPHGFVEHFPDGWRVELVDGQLELLEGKDWLLGDVAHDEQIDGGFFLSLDDGGIRIPLKHLAAERRTVRMQVR